MPFPKIISIILQQPGHISLASWNSLYKYFSQYFIQSTSCFFSIRTPFPSSSLFSSWPLLLPAFAFKDFRYYPKGQKKWMNFGLVIFWYNSVNHLPHMAISGSSKSAAKDMMSEIWTNGDTIIWLSKKTLWEKMKLFVTSNFFFSHNVFRSYLLLMHQN